MAETEPFASARATVAAAAAAVAALQDEEVLEQIVAVGATLGESIAAGGHVWLFGNGGSAADAQHIAAELVGRLHTERRALPAEALTVNASVVTAIANDYGFERVFARQLQAHGRAGDVAVGISTSGRSPNVLEGLRTAMTLGLKTVALTGRDGAALRTVAAQCIVVPTSDAQRVQECHILIGHILCELVEASIGVGR
jgi:D-sedoheptulose 7-phosphate isomerase